MSTSVERVDLDRARLELDRLAVARQIVGALAVDLDGREAGGTCMISPVKLRQQRLDRLARRAQRRWCATTCAFGVVGVGLGAPAHGEAVGFAPSTA